jgi:hypothetical protein
LRLTDELNEWADVIVRFAPYPGPPEREEAHWYSQWLDRKPNRRLVYVCRDYDAEEDYWGAVLASLPTDAPDSVRSRVEAERTAARRNRSQPPRPDKDKLADPTDWFAVPPVSTAPKVCTTLNGPWAVGVDAAKAAIAVHETPDVDAETVLLDCGETQALAIEWTRYNQSRVLVLANGSFVLNAALLNPARRPLTERVVEWASGDEPAQVAFVEGRFVIGKGPANPSIWGILGRVASIRWVIVQMLILGLAACLAKAPRLGRARPEPPSDADRPAAHPEALGALLARAGRSHEARSILDEYRRWRFPSRMTRPAADAKPTAKPLKTEPFSEIERPDL